LEIFIIYFYYFNLKTIIKIMNNNKILLRININKKWIIEEDTSGD